MATYTDNYQLTKPTYAEQADIGVVNSNMNIIDDVMHSSQISLAPAYDQSQTYAEGDVVMYELLMYKCISPTTGAWDGSKWERTTASESGGGGSAELDILGEASGAVASFSDGASAELAKCIADIEATQDLHGYDKPWVGGAGKNRFETTATSTTVSSITYTVNDNGTINTAGISDSSGGLNIGTRFTLPAGTYILSGCPIGGSASTYKLFLSEANVEDTGSGVTFTITQTTTFDRLRIVIYNGVNADDLEFKPMICLSSASAPTTFEPYSNICPISGSTSVTVTVSDGETSTTKTTPLGQTVYGGQLNVLTGELTITKRIITENDFTMMSSGASGGGLNYFQIPSTEPKATSGEAISNMLVQNQSGWGSTTPCFTVNTGSAPNIYPVRVYASSTSLATFKTDYAGLQIVYELATPQTVQLTPQEVNSLLGQNNISADTGDIDIVYVKASAPIQPNPTGTPTATLKKLGIEGAVFELEGGGGGSSSGINYSTTEQVVGTVEMDNGTIKPLYERSWWLTIPSQSGGYIFPNTSMADLDQVISNEYSFDGRGMRSYTYWYSGASIVFDEHTSSGISFYFGSGDYGGRMIFYTARYTKTTD